MIDPDEILRRIVEHSPKLRDIKKIIFYANAELERLEKYEHSILLSEHANHGVACEKTTGVI